MGSGSSALAATYQLYILSQQGVDKVLEGLALGAASPECLPLLRARADVGLYIRVYLLKLAQNLLNELLYQLSLYSAQIFASAQ